MTESSFSNNTHSQIKKLDYKKYDQRVRNICRPLAKAFSRSGNFWVDDYIQIACIKVWQSFDNFDSSKQLLPYVRAIARNAFIDINKSPQNMLMLSYDEAYQESTVGNNGQSAKNNIDDDPIDSGFNPSEYPESCFSNDDIESLLSTLNDRERQVIKKSYGIDCLYEMNDSRIAEDLHVSRQTVISDKKAAMRKLRNRIVL